MSNNGLHSNGSQFIIALRPLPWMHTKYVAFGFAAPKADVSTCW